MFRVKSLGASVKRQHRAAGDLEAGDVTNHRSSSGNRLGGPRSGNAVSGDRREHRRLNRDQARPSAGLRCGSGEQLEAFSAHAVLG